MGIDLHCGEISFGSSYTGWNELRLIIIQATIDYIQDKFQKDYELYNNLTDDDDNWIGEGSDYDYFKRQINDLFTSIKNEKASMPFNNSINCFVNKVRSNSQIDALVYFDIYGLYSLCNKNDCEGYYSPGNSVDICNLLDLIKPFIKNIDEDVYGTIYEASSNELYKLFKESVITNQKIRIA